KVHQKIENILFQKGIALLFIAILLGRALILSHLTPFALPFFAAVYILRREKAPLILFGLLVGSFTLSISQAIYTLALCLSFLIVFKLVKGFIKNPIKSLP